MPWSKEPRPKVGASSKEKARLNLGHMPHNRAIHPRAKLTCNSTRHYLAFSREAVINEDSKYELELN